MGSLLSLTLHPICVPLPEHPEAARVGSRTVSDGGDDSYPAVSALLRSHLRVGGGAD